MPSPIDLSTIITDPEGAPALVVQADQLGRSLKNGGLATNQIRALFGEVRQIQGQWSMDDEGQKALARRRLYLLKPKMAYRARKERGRAVEELVNVLDPALDYVLNEEASEKQYENFTRFVEFFEAILAYHKAHGGN
ncbi:MAG: type III-A CRISPR-associated protein Csm2 [Caldilineales bacterium]|nr:type III-A CRISPR-associated protein Csm2 [Caldilineales bacterium]